jgi:hypothetical protein
MEMNVFLFTPSRHSATPSKHETLTPPFCFLWLAFEICRDLIALMYANDFHGKIDVNSGVSEPRNETRHRSSYWWCSGLAFIAVTRKLRRNYPPKIGHH